jgi:hypothetical protein
MTKSPVMVNALPSSEESARARRLALGIYGAYCLIGFAGVVVGFSKGGTSRLVGAAFDLAIFVLALCFLTKAMADPPPHTAHRFFSRGLVALPGGISACPEICLLLAVRVSPPEGRNSPVTHPG